MRPRLTPAQLRDVLACRARGIGDEDIAAALGLDGAAAVREALRRADRIARRAEHRQAESAQSRRRPRTGTAIEATVRVSMGMAVSVARSAFLDAD